MKKDGVYVSEIKEGNISLILESYNDIFSSFDPRPSSERALSDDFLSECKRATIDREEPITLRFLVPHSKRNLKEELEIQFRLKNHFHKHYLEKRKEIRNLRLQGLGWFVLGTIAMILATFFSERINFYFNLLKVMLEPAGWFFFWEGLYKIAITAQEKMPSYAFYKKMDPSRVLFLSY